MKHLRSRPNFILFTFSLSLYGIVKYYPKKNNTKKKEKYISYSDHSSCKGSRCSLSCLMNGNAAGGDPLFVTQGENNKYCNKEKFHWYIKAPDTVTLLFSKWNLPFSISLSLSTPTFTFPGVWVDGNNEVMYAMASKITFICQMDFNAFPVDIQVT